jgi:nicotinamidase-related amidase
MSKYAFFIDCQVGFTTGSLANPAAAAKLPYLKKEFGRLIGKRYKFAYTEDTHSPDEEEYKKTLEGQYIPYHCGSVEDRLTVRSLRKEFENLLLYPIRKDSFGTPKLAAYLRAEEVYEPIEEIRLYGFVTEICVVSNALLLRSFFPNVRIVVDAAGCAGLSPEGHEAALAVMRACLIEVVND